MRNMQSKRQSVLCGNCKLIRTYSHSLLMCIVRYMPPA